MPKPIRVLLADDHPVLHLGVRAMLEAEPDLEVVGEACTGAEAVRQAEALRPDVVLMDLEMPEMGGLEATRRTAALGLGIRVLILSMHPQREHLIPVLEAGARGFVMKSRSDERLAEAVRVVHRGDIYLDPNGRTILLREYHHLGAPRADPLEALTGREREVLVRTAVGYSSREIGEQLYISPKTVDTYRSRLYQKLGFSHRSELVHFALDAGLLNARLELGAPTGA